MSTNSLKMDVLGVWQLKSRQDRDSSGNVVPDPALGPDPLGMLCFSPQHFAAQFMKRDRSGASEPTRRTPGGNNSIAVAGYDAYFGTYTLDETAGTLRTHLDASISPSNIGSEFVRHIKVHENELTITLATTSADAIAVTRTLVFSRLG